MTAGKIIFLLYWSWILAKSACSQTLSDINCVLQRNPGTDPNKQVIRHERWSAWSTGRGNHPNAVLRERQREYSPAVCRLLRFSDEVELEGPNTALDPKNISKIMIKKNIFYSDENKLWVSPGKVFVNTNFSNHCRMFVDDKLQLYMKN